jgi:hypothetical protein
LAGFEEPYGPAIPVVRPDRLEGAPQEVVQGRKGGSFRVVHLEGGFCQPGEGGLIWLTFIRGW